MGRSLRTHALLVTVLVAATACGGSSQLPLEANSQTALRAAAKHHQTFEYTGKRQSFTVPAGVTKISVVAEGAGSPSHAGRESSPSWVGSNGGLLKATIPVTAGEKLGIYVGGAGAIGTDGAGGSGGFNGGADGGQGPYGGSYSNGGEGGGGASDVREGANRLKDRVLIAAGGGYPGNGSGGGGQGGTSSTGGSGGPGGSRSGYGQGSPGSAGGKGSGGSSYAESAASRVKTVAGGATNGNGEIVISW